MLKHKFWGLLTLITGLIPVFCAAGCVKKDKTVPEYNGSIVLTDKTSAVLDDNLCAGNEDILFSFKIKNSAKVLSVCIEKNNEYLVYRYGGKDDVEFEFPDDVKVSYDKFTFSENWTSIFRGYYLEFTNQDYKYTVYQKLTLDDYRSHVESTECGVYVKKISAENVSELTGNPETIMGALGNIDGSADRLLNNNKLKKMDYGNINYDGEDYSREYY
jgi:hypothetical protein